MTSERRGRNWCPGERAAGGVITPVAIFTLQSPGCSNTVGKEAKFRCAGFTGCRCLAAHNLNQRRLHIGESGTNLRVRSVRRPASPLPLPRAQLVFVG